MTLHPASESSDFCWKLDNLIVFLVSKNNLKSLYRSLAKDVMSSERLDEGARPVFSEQLVLTSDGIQHFIPEYIREKFHGRIEPNLCTIKVVCKTEAKEPFYTFVLSWYKDQAQRDTDSVTLTSKSKKSPISVTSRTELKEKRPMQNRETTVEIGEQTRHCDGPCGKMRSVKELQVHGRCEHAICPLCTINAPMIENIDGSMGCCNPECFAADLAALCPDPVLRHKYFQMIINKNKIDEIMAIYHGRKDRNMKRLQRAIVSLSSSRTSSASKSNRDKRGIKELICIKALVLEKGPMETICRRHSISEIASTEFLRNALQCVVGDRQNLHKSRIFFNYGRNIKDDSQLKEIDLKQYGDKEINYFPPTNGTLNFVIDYTNFIGGNSISPCI